MIITPMGLKEQILGRLISMIGKSKEDNINFNTPNSMIVTVSTHGIYKHINSAAGDSVFDMFIFLSGIKKDSRGNVSVLIENRETESKYEAPINLFNVEDLYEIYQKLSHIISPSNAIYTDVIDES